MGHIFVLHRETGKPLFPVEERPVPQSDVPGEETSPTQPFPKLPRVLAPQRLTPEAAWGMTPADRDWCRERIKSLRNEGIFTPPSLRGSLFFPGNVGGSNWGGVSYDPQRGLLIAPTNRLPFTVKLIRREDFAKERANAADNRLKGEFGTQRGTPYAMYRELGSAAGNCPANGFAAAVERLGFHQPRRPRRYRRRPGLHRRRDGYLPAGV
jgi:quinoprotein glucose dehydrogenase